ACIIQAEPGEPAHLEILDQHIRSCGKLAHEAAPFLALEIELDRALAAVGGMEIGGIEVAAVRRLDKGRSPSARVVAGPLALDLYNVCAEVGQDLARPGSGEDAGKLEHAQSGHGSRH